MNADELVENLETRVNTTLRELLKLPPEQPFSVRTLTSVLQSISADLAEIKDKL